LELNNDKQSTVVIEKLTKTVYEPQKHLVAKCC